MRTPIIHHQRNQNLVIRRTNSVIRPLRHHIAEDMMEEPQLGPFDPDHNRVSAEIDAREATELGRLGRHYTHASSYHQQRCSISSRNPTAPLVRFKYSLSKFWGHQVSVVVPHEACRDHLGTLSQMFSV